MQISDLLIEFNLQILPWSNYVIQYINNDPISSLVLTRSLIFQYQNINISDILTNILIFIFNELQRGQKDPLFLRISFKIIRKSINIIKFDENQLIFLIQYIINNFSKDFILQYISIFAKISTLNPMLIHQIEFPLISNLVQYITIPKVAIRFFSMISIFSKNDELWKIIEPNFLNFIIPFFTVNENEINDPINFVNNHYFDSFSSNSDPNSAAFRCLEVISQYHNSIIEKILQLLKSEFENNTHNIYSISHIASAVLKNYDFAKFSITAKYLFNFVFSFLKSNSTLVKCGSLIILQFESYLDAPSDDHVRKCIELIFDENDLIQFFSMNVLSKIASQLKSTQIFQSFPPNIVISKILQIAQKYEVPQITDLLQFLFNDNFYLTQISPFLFETVNSTFSLAAFYVEVAPDSISISSVFNTILTIILNLKGNSIASQICKLSYLRSIQLINTENKTILTSLLEVILASFVCAHELFPEMWNAFDLLVPLLGEMQPFAREVAFSILSVTSLRDVNGSKNRSTMLSNLAQAVISNYEVNEFQMFIATLIKLNGLQNDIFSTLMCKIFLTWQNDSLEFFDGFFELVAVLFEICPLLFPQVFGDSLPDFLEDVVDAAGVKYLMLLVPRVFRFLSNEQMESCMSIIDSKSEKSPANDESDDFAECSLRLPQVSLFSDSEIVYNYQEFIKNCVK